MGILIRFSAIIVSIAACGVCALRFFALQNAKSVLESASFQRERTVAVANSNESQLINVARSSWTNFDERSQAAVLLAEISEKSGDPEQKIRFLCDTLSGLTSALKAEPLNARALVTWSNVRQLLGSYQCEGQTDESASQGEFKEALRYAREVHPLDQQALFNAGLIFLWSGEKQDAYPLLRRVLELGSDSTILQRDYIYSLVSDETTLRALVPARIPQALEFVRYRLAQPQAAPVQKIAKSVLWNFEATAVTEFNARFERGEIEARLYGDRLLELWSMLKESAVTPQLDKLLGNFYQSRGQPELATFFSSRSRLNEIPVLVGLRTSDSRPEKSALAYWGSTTDISFDEFYTSVGFFFPRGKTIRRIELHARTLGSDKVSGLIRVLQSDDNASWEDVSGNCIITPVNLEGRSVVYIDVPGSTKRFWKLHYASHERNQEFGNPIKTMVRVFGIGALKG